MVEELRLTSIDHKQAPIDRVRTGVFSVILADAGHRDLESDEIFGKLLIRFRDVPPESRVVAKGDTDLNALSIRLLENWWRILCRRDDPFELLPMRVATLLAKTPGAVRARSLGGRIQLTAFRENEPDIDRFLTEERFSDAVLDGLVRPVVEWLRLGRRFDWPVEAMLRRLEDVLRHPNERAFCRTAGALALSPHALDVATAQSIRWLIEAIAEDDARLDFASAISADLLEQTWEWIASEIRAKEATNCLPGLPDLHREVRARPPNERVAYRIGYACARTTRAVWGIADDRPLGGTSGLARLLGGKPGFAPSQADEGRIRGFQARGDSSPVVVVRDEGTRSNAFLTARAIGDYVWFGSREAPVANLYTNRQALGRAFAAEFLAPGAAVVHMVEEEEESFDKIADHFGVVTEVIERQYSNARPEALAF